MKKNSDWVVLTELTNLEESKLIRGMLETAGIPVDLRYETAGELFGLTVGPLSRIFVLIPLEYKSEAEKLLDDDNHFSGN